MWCRFHINNQRFNRLGSKIRQEEDTNRRVAQESASWMDASRRPLKFNIKDLSVMVRERILTPVPGARALDFDANENDAESAITILLFGRGYPFNSLHHQSVTEIIVPS